MKKISLAILAFTLVFTFSSCLHMGRGVKGSGNRKTEKRDLKPFKAIDTSGAYEIDVTCQKSASFEIEGDDNILPLIRTEVRDGILFVSSERSYNSRKPIALRITLPDLANISTHGAGEVKIADVKNDNLEIQSTGAAAVDAAGQTKSLALSSTGAGQIDASNLRAEKARVDVTGAASVDVYASEQLDVNVSGAGHVAYSGDPKIVNKNVSGIGSVSKKESD